MADMDLPEGGSHKPGFPGGHPSRVQQVNMDEDIEFPEGWFEAIGFPKGNPFRAKQPDMDQEFEPCFQHKAYFNAVCGQADQPTTTILSGHRGCGKSANRKMLERLCLRGRLGGLILPVLYTDFSRFVEQPPHTALAPTARNHVDAILRNAVIALLNLLVDHPELTQKLYSPGDKALLKHFVVRYSKLLTPAGMDNWLRSVGILSKAVNFGKIMEAVRTRSTVDWSRLTVKGSAAIQVLVDLQQASLAPASPLPADAHEEISYVAQLESFVSLVTFLGVKAVYILIDRIDEVPELADDPTRQAALIEPLMSSLPLMDLPKTAFKFFIPTEVADLLRQRRTIRPDRLLFRSIFWLIPDLVAFMGSRLEVYSNRAFSDLSQFCVPGMEDIMTDIARHSYGSPRNMLRISEALIYEAMLRTSQHTGNVPRINQEDYRRVLKRFEAEVHLDAPMPTAEAPVAAEVHLDAPMPTAEAPVAAEAPAAPMQGLSLDQAGRVCRYGKELKVKLSDSQYKLLSFFCQNPGKLLEYQQLIGVVYGPTKSSKRDRAAFHAVVRRLRQKIEPDPHHPRFIIAAPALGYRFEPQGQRE